MTTKLTVRAAIALLAASVSATLCLFAMANGLAIWDTAEQAAPDSHQSDIKGLDTITGAFEVTLAPFAPGDVFAAVAGRVKHFTSSGELRNTLIGSGGFIMTGMAFDSAGNLYATDFSSGVVDKFDTNGTFLGAFLIEDFLDPLITPESLVFDAAGHLYVGQGYDSRVHKFDSEGNKLASFAVTTGRGSDWIDLAADQCTLFYTSEGGQILRFDVCHGTQLPVFATPGGNLYALRIRPNGEVLVAADFAAFRLDCDGRLLQTYTIPDGGIVFPLTLDPDGTTFWAGRDRGGTISRIDIATGDIRTTFASGSFLLGGLAVAGNLATPTPTPPTPACGGTVVVLSPQKDNTLYQIGEELSNGRGIYLFTGRTQGNGVHRGLIAFDLTAIPANATVTEATLSMFLSLSPGPSGAQNPVSLSKALSAWGEGASDAGIPGIEGAPAATGDATWNYTFYSTFRWAIPGGDFSPIPSAAIGFADVDMTYTWPNRCGEKLIPDVQAWVSNPASNFGWVIRGDEHVPGRLLGWNTRENSSHQPKLTVTYQVSPQVSPCPTPTPTPTPTPMPCPGLIFGENFDAVVAPGLPTGWVATNITGSATRWVTSTTAPQTVPNDAFVDDQENISDKCLDSPDILITSATAQLCFRNNFNTEYDPPPAEVFWDGGVLEVSVNAGPFLDVTDPAISGGVFVTGGYTGEIDGTAHNPLAGRQAWSGDSGGYIDTVINLVASLKGKTIKLRFRMGTDPAVAAPGWRIDTIKIAPVGAGCCGGTMKRMLVNASTRLLVQAGDNVGIGGFIITGSAPKHVLLRAIGPSLAQFGVPNALADPVLELHGPDLFVTITNNNWRDTQEAAILATGIPPTNNLEAAIDAVLAPGAYTAVVTGNGNASGVALVEIYDLNQGANSKLANLSTRAFVGTGDNIVIAGVILGGGGGTDWIVVRGIGPSLSAFGISSALANPTLELRDGNGALLVANNDWQENPEQAKELTGLDLAPTNSLESGIAGRMPPGLYTALLAGLNNGTGVGLVEVYDVIAP